MTTLDRMPPGRRARVLALSGEPALVQRLCEMGLVEGDEVEVLAVAPLGDPVEVRCGHSRISLRKSEAAGVSVSGEW